MRVTVHKMRVYARNGIQTTETEKESETERERMRGEAGEFNTHSANFTVDIAQTHIRKHVANFNPGSKTSDKFYQFAHVNA